VTTRKATKAAQKRAVRQQVPVESDGRTDPPEFVQWFCGGCGTTIQIPWCEKSVTRGLSLEVTRNGDKTALALAECAEPYCDARIVRCANCGGGPAARAALSHHTCRAVLT
jgi:hypothetical protein